MNNIFLNNFRNVIKLKETPYYRESLYREVVSVPKINTTYGRATFSYFLPKFVNTVMKLSFNLPMKDFKQSISKNLEHNFNVFTFTFSNFSNFL